MSLHPTVPALRGGLLALLSAGPFGPSTPLVPLFGQGDRTSTWMMAVAGVPMVAGVIFHLSESHGHAHDHEVLEREHANHHNDGHHLHTHETTPAGKHSQQHRHAPTRHSQLHVPDAHHLHTH